MTISGTRETITYPKPIAAVPREIDLAEDRPGELANCEHEQKPRERPPPSAFLA